MKNCLQLALIGLILTISVDLSAQIHLTFNTTPPSCNGYTDGTATVTATNGVEPYTYAWNTGTSGPQLTGVSAGTYTVSVTDNNGQSTSGLVTITEPPAVVANIAASGNLCTGNSGQLTANAQNGVGFLTFNWSTNETTQTINVNAPGNFSVTVTDEHGCADDANYTLANSLQASITVTNVLCASDPNNGALSVVALGGVAPYTYSWQDGNTEPIRQNLPAGTYSVTVHDSNGCSASAQATITMPPPLDVVVISITPACNGLNNGGATIMAIGGTPPYTHTWTPGGFTGSTVTGLAPGQYYVCTFDANHCQKDLWVTIPDGLNVHLSVTSAECAGVDDGTATAVVNPPGNYIYHWNLPPFNGVTQLTGLAPETQVSVTVTDPVSGCTGTATATISAHNVVHVDVTDTDIPCQGQNIGTASANAYGGTPDYSYVWLLPPSGPPIGNGPNISGLGPGAYIVSVTDAKGCTATGQADISVLSAPHAVIGGLDDVICGKDTSGFDFHNLSTDPYDTIVAWTWTVTTPGGQQTFNNVNLLHLELPVGTPGNVLLKVTSSTGCMDTVSKNFIVPGIPNISLGVDSIMDCHNLPVHFVVSGGHPWYAYTWSPLDSLTLDPIPPNATANPSVTTIYQLIADDQGCADTVTVKVIRVTPADIMVDTNLIKTCDSLVTLHATSNFPVIWVDAEGHVLGNDPVTVAVTDSSVYTAIANGEYGCADSVRVTVIGNTIDVSVDTLYPNMVCVGDTIQLGLINHNPADTLTYHWTADPPLVIIDGDSPHPYVTSTVADTFWVTVIVSNQTGCTDTLHLPVIVKSQGFLFNAISADLCNGKEVHFFNNSGLPGVWTFGDGDSSLVTNPVHIYADSGYYHVHFAPLNDNCTYPWDSTIHVYEFPLDTPGITYTFIDCVDSARIQFNGTSNHTIVKWQWTFMTADPGSSMEQNPIVTVHQEGLLTAKLVVMDDNGCTDSSQVVVDVWFLSNHFPDTLLYCMDTTGIYLNPQGVDSSATYLWTANPPDSGLDSTAMNPLVHPTVTTLYTVTVTQNDNCTITDSVLVLVHEINVALDPQYPNMFCAGDTIQLGLINHIPGDILTYHWSADPPLVLIGADSPHPYLTSQEAGMYNVTVTVSNQYGCTDTLVIPIKVKVKHNLQGEISTDLCNGKEVHFFNTSGLPGTWLFGDGDSSLIAEPVHIYPDSGHYHVVFTPLNDMCTLPWDSTIHVYEFPLDTPGITYTFIDCVDSARIQFNGTSNHTIVKWQWTFMTADPGSSMEQNPMVTVHQEGPLTAKLVVMDDNGCTDSSQVVVDVWFLSNHFPDTLLYCMDTTGIYLNPQGVDSSATYLWTANPPDSGLDSTVMNPLVHPTVTTLYTVTVTQNDNCTITDSVLVLVHEINVALDPQYPNMFCAGDTIQLGLINHIPGDILTYHWSADPPLVLIGADSPHPYLTSQEAGMYNVTVTVSNQYGCTDTLVIPIKVKVKHNLQHEISADLCNGKEVHFFNTSGLPGTWLFGDGDSSLVSEPVHIYPDSGHYHVVFTPLNDMCTLPWDSTIHVYEFPLDTPVITYTFIDCIDSARIQFNGTSNHTIVKWQWTFMTADPGSSMEQNPIVAVHQEGPLTAKLVVMDDNGCTDSSQVVVDVWFLSNHFPDTLLYCMDTTGIYLNPQGVDSSATYLWTANPPDSGLDSMAMNPLVHPTVTTLYTVTVTQNGNCTITDSVLVIVHDVNVEPDPEYPTMFCVGDTIQLGLINHHPGDILTYHWSADPPLVLIGADSPHPYLTSQEAGMYNITVTVSNQYGCTDTLVIPIKVKVKHNLQGEISADLCNGKEVHFFNTSGLPGTWLFGDGDSSLIAEPVHIYQDSGHYHVVFTPLNDMCTLPWDSIIHVYQFPLDTPGITYTFIDCIDSARIQFNGTSNHTIVKWQWTFNPGTPDSSMLQNPVVTVHQEGLVHVQLIVTDDNGCMDTSHVAVDVWFLSDHLADTIVYCKDTIGVHLNPGGVDTTATFLWTANPPDPGLDSTSYDPIVNPNVPTWYTAHISQAGTICTITDSVLVIPMFGPNLMLPPDMTFCHDTTITIVATGGGDGYLWSDSLNFHHILSDSASLTVIAIPNGMYYVTSSLNGCIAVDSIKINNGTVHVGTEQTNFKICAGDEAQLLVLNLDSTSNLSYHWNPALPDQPGQVVTPGTTTDYHVTVTNQFNCTAEISFHVEVIQVSVTASLTSPDTLCQVHSTGLLATPGGNGTNYVFEWSPAGTLSDSHIPNPVANPEQEQTYTVTVTDDLGCTATDDVTVRYTVCQCEEPYIFVPDVFTPNDDGHNDFFIVRGNNITELMFIVWDRWGEKVYETSDVTAIGWDGTYKGRHLTPDSYAWYVHARCGNGQLYEKKGNVTLLR